MFVNFKELMNVTNINAFKVYHIVIFFLVLLSVLTFLIFACVFHDISNDKCNMFYFCKIKGEFSYSFKTFI